MTVSGGRELNLPYLFREICYVSRRWAYAILTLVTTAFKLALESRAGSDTAQAVFRAGLIIPGILFVTPTFGANLTILVVGEGGRPINGCKVVEFRTLGGHSDGADVSSKFSGLKAVDIPTGDYEAKISCAGTGFSTTVALTRPDQFEVSSMSHQIIRSHIPAELAVSLTVPRLSHETWWIRITNAYSGVSQADNFGRDGIARLVGPSDGRYLVTVSSTGGYMCTREVEMIEFTRTWSFDSATCAFVLDRFAHAVDRGEDGLPRATGWSNLMNAFKNELTKSLESGAKVPQPR